MFIIIFVSNIMVNVDHGSLPGCSVRIKQDLTMGDLQFGVLGSIVYAGMGSGASAAAWLYERSNWIKLTLASTLLLNGASVIMMTVSDSFYFNVFVRFWIGFFQVFQSIYMPVWADNYAAEKQKSAWMTFLILASVLGIVLGFSVTSMMLAYVDSWRWSFILQGLTLVPLALLYLFYPIKYLNIEKSVRWKNKCKLVVEQKLYKAINQQQISSTQKPTNYVSTQDTDEMEALKKGEPTKVDYSTKEHDEF